VKLKLGQLEEAKPQSLESRALLPPVGCPNWYQCGFRALSDLPEGQNQVVAIAEELLLRECCFVSYREINAV